MADDGDGLERGPQDVHGGDDGEPAGSLVGEASEAAFATLSERLAEAGGRPLCAFMVVLAAGVEPNGGVFFVSDEDDGPDDPEEIVNFALAGVSSWAQAQGVPVAIMDVPAGPGGQG